jgi:hypothetical protein
MRGKRILLAAIAFCLAGSAAWALWSVSDHGAWPQTWPKQLESLRAQSGTMQGGIANLVIHHIPFKDRESFEAAWPHLLSVKTNGAPIILMPGSTPHWHFGPTKAGVMIHCPSGGVDRPELAKPIDGVQNIHMRWHNTTYIELFVDGDVVDLNRIQLPPDTPIIDKRFKDREVKVE